MDAKTFKNLMLTLFVLNHLMYLAMLQTGSFGLLKLHWFSAVHFQISLEGYLITWVISFSFAKGQACESNQCQYYVYIQDNPERTSADMELWNCWYGKQKLLIWKTETAIFLATMHEKKNKQLWHAVIYFFINISFILSFWPAVLSKIKVFI